MKKLVLILAAAIGSIHGFAQTATNFNCMDCASATHDLFTELDAGKVVVLCWVMPCSACTGPATTASNLVQNYQATNPGRVVFYMADDYANTSCNILSSWAGTNGITNATFFSDAAVSMSDYGSPGMPKTVVLGGTSHNVFYNMNNGVNSVALQAAIDSALVATNVVAPAAPYTSLALFPNPANNNATISYSLEKQSDVTIEVFNLLGEKVQVVYSGNQPAGNYRTDLNCGILPKGRYVVRMIAGEIEKTKELSVLH
jgi:hypothetical protein